MLQVDNNNNNNNNECKRNYGPQFIDNWWRKIRWEYCYQVWFETKREREKKKGTIKYEILAIKPINGDQSNRSSAPCLEPFFRSTNNGSSLIMRWYDYGSDRIFFLSLWLRPKLIQHTKVNRNNFFRILERYLTITLIISIIAMPSRIMENEKKKEEKFLFLWQCFALICFICQIIITEKRWLFELKKKTVTNIRRKKKRERE